MDAMSKKVAALKIPPTAMFKPNMGTTFSSIAQTEKNSSSGMYSKNCFIDWLAMLTSDTSALYRLLSLI